MTITKTKVLTFDERNYKLPVVCTLAKKYNLDFSILKAKVLPRRAGMVVLEISGDQAMYEAGLKYLEENGVGVHSLEQEIFQDADECTQCGACVGFCPSDALAIDDYSNYRIVFHPDRCIGCEICLTACPARAMKFSSSLVDFEAPARNV